MSTIRTISEWKRTTQDMTVEQMKTSFPIEWVTGSMHAWKAVLMLGEIDRTKAWQTEARSINEWVLKQKIPGLTAPPTVSRLVNVSRWFRDLDDNSKIRWITQSVWDAAEVTAIVHQFGEEAAYRIASADDTTSHKRHRVKELLGAQAHHDTSELRTFTTRLTADAYATIEKALNAAMHMLAQKQPAKANALEMIAANFLSGFIFDSSELAIPHESPYRARLVAEMTNDVLDGKLRCLDCGAWHPIQRHHCPPRSFVRKKYDGSRWDPDDPEWPCIYLCADCHAKAHETPWETGAERWKNKDARYARRLSVFLK